MSRRVQILLITICCLGAYFALRSLPVEECAFLHYGDFVNSEGAIEGCGYEETEFFDMTEIRYPILARLTPIDELRIGIPTTVELTLFTTTGKPIAWEEIAISHTERIHAMVIDPSLKDYHHLHPQPAGPSGHYLMEFTPARPGPYRVYLDFIPLINSKRTLLSATLEVPGASQAPLFYDQNNPVARDGLEFSFLPEQDALVTDRELRFQLRVSARDGRPVLFEPVMDSFAHVVAFDEAGTGFAHLHPQNPFIEGQDPANPDLEFAFVFDQPGRYRVWAQLIVNGQHTFVPFDLLIRES